MKQLPFFVCLILMSLLVPVGVTSANDTETTIITTATTAPTTTTPERTGGSVFFDTEPAGATIWVDNSQIGTSDLTYYSPKTGPLEVLILRKGYEDFTATVTVEEGRRIEFFARLTPLPRGIADETPITAAPVTTATTIRKSTLDIPTPWPASTQSPVDPAVITLAAAAGLMFFVIRRR